MGCAASSPAAAEPSGVSVRPVHLQPTATHIPSAATSPSLKRAPSAPVIRIDADTDPTKSSSAGSGAAPPASSSSSSPGDFAGVVDAAVFAASRDIPVGDQVAKAADSGVMAILALMKQHAGDAEFQWWCCDALASLAAGNETNRAQIFVNGGLLQILAAMRLFAWDENVQTKAGWALAGLAASYADHCGKQGAVEAVLAGMRSCPDSYQVLTTGVRALQNLVAGGSEANRVRAVAAGALPLLDQILEANPEDGQLQWRGKELAKRLAEMDEATAAELERTGVTEVARNSPWSRLRQAILAGQAKTISAGNVPGLFGIAAQVADAAAQGGVPAVLAFMRQHAGYHEAQTWCCDSLAALMTGDEPARMAVYTGGGLELVLAAMRGAVWDEELQLKALWALLALAPSFASEIGDAGAVGAVVATMYANRTAHQVQVAGVKLISLLTIEPYRKNAERAVEANAVRIIKAVIAAHAEDGTLQYRGVNLLERLQPGCTLEMPKQSMIRSYSMRAEEMVSQYRTSAKSFAASESRASMSAGTTSGPEGVDVSANGVGAGGAGTARSSRMSEADRAALSKKAIAEVDELAEAVEEHGDDAVTHATGDATSRTDAHPGSVPDDGGGGGGGAEGETKS